MTAVTHTQELAEVRVDSLVASDENPRILDVKSQRFKDLVESVRASGVIIPLTVTVEDDGTMVVRAGARRLAAAQAAERESVPAILHRGLSDLEKFKLTFFENFCREDLRPIEEARAVAILLERHKGDFEAVAADLGKARNWVHQRHHLVDALSKKWLTRMGQEDGEYANWTVAHWNLLARLPKETQDRLDIYHGRGQTVADLRSRIAAQLLVVNDAPWAKGKEEERFKGLPTCGDCAMRSSASPMLWKDDDKAKGAKNDLCLNPHCWGRHIAARLRAAAAAAKKETGAKDVVFIVDPKNRDYNEKQAARKGLKKDVLEYGITVVKEGTKGAKPAVLATGPNAGKVVHVKVESYGYGRSGAKKAKKLTVAERRVMLEANRWVEALGRFMTQHEAVPLTDVVGGKAGMIKLAVLCGTEDYGAGKGRLHQQYHEYCNAHNVKDAMNASVFFATAYQVWKTPDWDQLLWERVWAAARSDMRFWQPQGVSSAREIVNKDAPTFVVLAQFIGIDANRIYAEVACEKKFVEPEGWAAEEAREKKRGEKAAAKKANGKGKKAAGKTKKSIAKESPEVNAEPARCRVCGCTETNACPSGCSWLEPDLCDRCAACRDCKDPGSRAGCPTVEKRHDAMNAYETADEDSDELHAAAFEAPATPPCGATPKRRRSARKGA